MEVAVEGQLTLGDQELILDAALADHGLAFVFEAYAKSALANGRLQRVLEDWCPAFPGFFLYYPSRRHTPPVLRAFLDMIREGTSCEMGTVQGLVPRRMK